MKKLFLACATLCIAFHAQAQKKISLELNSGYTIGLGDKVKDLEESGDETPTFASFSEGLIPLGLTAGYQFNDNIQFIVSLKRQMGLPHSYDVAMEGVSLKTEWTETMNMLGLGANYYFKNDKFSPYVGLDLGIALITAKGEIEVSFQGESQSEESTLFKNEITPYFSPKVGFNYMFGESLYLNSHLSYTYLFSKKVAFESSDDDDKVNVDAAGLIGINVGIGYKF